MAGALYLARELPATGLPSREAAEGIASELRRTLPTRLLPDIVKAMEQIQAWRASYVAKHRSSFSSKHAVDEYMRAWVANYEISDLLTTYGPPEGGVLFLRFNQWPEREQAAHEEAARMEEERRFGGRPGDKSQVVHDFSAGDAMVVVESFGPGPGPVGLHSPREWCTAVGGAGALCRVAMVLDVNGHFVAACPVADWDGTGRPALVVFNTTSASYLGGAGGHMAAAAFDLVFSPPPPAAVAAGVVL